MLSIFKENTYQHYLFQLPKIAQLAENIEFFHSPAHFRATLLEQINNAVQRICISTLYFEQDESGSIILNSLYNAKRKKPELKIQIFVDWHRAQRNKIGISTSRTNADWYHCIAKKNSDVEIPVFGIPINTREAFGVMHIKGFIIDDVVLYSGASISNLYLHQNTKYRYDRYHLIRNAKMANAMFDWIYHYFIMNNYKTYCLNNINHIKNKKIKNKIRLFRKKIKNSHYIFQGDANNQQLSVTPLIGLGKSNILNKTITHLIQCVDKKLIFCTPYFNLPATLVKHITELLYNGKKVEIIVGDKTTNDFFIPEEQPFKIIGILPYLYETNLRKFLYRLQHYIDSEQLIVRLWKHKDNSYHIKGIWIDKIWVLITGNNLNARAFRLDLENAILIHDPNAELSDKFEEELTLIRYHTIIIKNYYDIQCISEYPKKIKKLMRRLQHTRIDRLIRYVL